MVRLRLFVLCWTLVFATVLAEKPRDLSWVDAYALAAPPEAEKSVKSLAKYLAGRTAEERGIKYSGTARDLQRIRRWDEERARAIYRWMTANIAYAGREAEWRAARATRNGRATLVHDNKKLLDPEKILQTRKTICLGYATLYRALAVESGLRCDLVTGNLTGDPDARHAWNEVRVGEARLGIDATWGTAEYEEWYLVPLSRFRKTHTPDWTPPGRYHKL
ncbi:MAG: hypothetical protein AMXMBFR33_10010 [Candidatus Xenobia bacterium]